MEKDSFGPRVRWAKSDKSPEVMSLESDLVEAENYKSGGQKCGGFELKRSELTRLLQPSYSLLETSGSRLH